MGRLISIAGRLLPSWRWLAAGAVLIAVAAGGVWLRSVIIERDELQARVEALQAELRIRHRIITLQRDAMAAADADRARAEAAYRNLQAARERVLRAPETDDAPIAPVLDDALRSLRRQRAGTTP